MLWWLWRLFMVSVDDAVPIEDEVIEGMKGGGLTG
jgi:hypothetical protein